MATQPHEPDPRPAADFASLRASDADRERVIDALKTAFVQGRLSRSGLARRTGHALQSRTYGELAGATAGIPARRAPAPARPQAAVPARPRPPTWKTVAWVVSLVIVLPGVSVACFATYYGAYIILLLLGFTGLVALGSPGYSSDGRHRAC